MANRGQTSTRAEREFGAEVKGVLSEPYHPSDIRSAGVSDVAHNASNQLLQLSNLTHGVIGSIIQLNVSLEHVCSKACWIADGLNGPMPSENSDRTTSTPVMGLVDEIMDRLSCAHLKIEEIFGHLNRTAKRIGE